MLFLAAAVGGLTALVFLYLNAAGWFHRSVALNPSNFKKFQLVARTPVSHDSFIFRFALENNEQKLGLPIGQHITIRSLAMIDGKEEMVQHAYTPISSDEDKGIVEFLIKVYLPNPQFPKGGRLTQYLHNLKIGDSVEMRGPHGNFTYLRNGDFEIDRPGKGKEKRHVDAFAMIAGGTGITPMMQILRAIKRNPEDQTKCFLIFGNQTEKDILLREELNALQLEDKRFRVWYTISREVPASWKFSSGYVTEEMIRGHLPIPTSFGTKDVPQNEGITSAQSLVCGPPAMVKFAAKPNLKKVGYGPADITVF